MNVVVVDASVIVDALLGKEPANARIFGAGEERHAPVSIDAEVLHGLRRKLVAQVITEEAASAAVKLYRRVTIHRHAVQPFIDRIWALRKNVTAYDAGYVALAEALEVPLLTRDGRLSRSAGHTARIEYVV